MPDNVTDDAPDSTDDTGSARHTWVASLISTVVTLPLAFFALVYSMLSPMACDSCSEADAHRFDASFGPAWTVSCCGLLLSLVILVASWVCARRRPPAAIGLAVAAPTTVFFTWVAFMTLINWP
ncbi:hypothetical protein OG887_17865 [Streptomyces sp. NBC_00053]|uniref:hypothetical protein n=1 Tax=unclassified Streptomyces TaxID=2593676 RepID=UPI00225027A9|nr:MULTISPECIES: hypothetical protein [unclassified Streptomyces]MCX5101447.1 hypothetical protein [Streptomyces sp. NBC_00439]MCX5501234.1 hypothetical protein [Streptomyces sp. NBC_00052]MCX5550231.1 hypothetical protein [Streptomyces sp. NBC_00051]